MVRWNIDFIWNLIDNYVPSTIVVGWVKIQQTNAFKKKRYMMGTNLNSKSI